MILVVTEHDLGSIIADLPGWSNLQVRYLTNQKGRRFYNIHLTKKQLAALGEKNVKATYQATEYNAEETESKEKILYKTPGTSWSPE